MKALLTLVALAGGVAMISGCAIAAPGLVTGGIFSSYKMGAGVGPGTGTKTGEACAMSILGIVGIGDASIDEAKKQGGVTQVASVDHDSFNILGIYGKVCTVVTGQ